MIAVPVLITSAAAFAIGYGFDAAGVSPFVTKSLLAVHLVATLPLAWVLAARIEPRFLLAFAGGAFLITPSVNDLLFAFDAGVSGGHAARFGLALGWETALFRLLAQFIPRPSLSVNALGAVVAFAIGFAVPAQFLDQQLNRFRSEALEAARAGKLFRAEDRLAKLRALGSSDFPLDIDRLREQLSELRRRAEYSPPGLGKAEALAQLGLLNEAMSYLDHTTESRLLRASILQDQEDYEASDREYRAIDDELRPQLDAPSARTASLLFRQAERVQNGLSYNARQRGDGPRAVEYAKDGLNRFPFNAAYWKFQLGLAHELADDPRSARVAFEEAVRSDPKIQPLVEPHLRRLHRGPGCIPR